MEIEMKIESHSYYGNRGAGKSNTYFMDLQDDDDENEENCLQKACLVLYWVSKNLMNIIHVLLLVGYIVYLCFAVLFDAEGSVVVFIIGILYLFYIIRKLFDLDITERCYSCASYLGSLCKRKCQQITKRYVTYLLSYCTDVCNTILPN